LRIQEIIKKHQEAHETNQKSLKNNKETPSTQMQGLFTKTISPSESIISSKHGRPVEETSSDSVDFRSEDSEIEEEKLPLNKFRGVIQK
jgi:hypothetical protein